MRPDLLLELIRASQALQAAHAAATDPALRETIHQCGHIVARCIAHAGRAARREMAQGVA